MSFPIGIQVYSVRDEAAKDFEGTLRAIKSYGYDGVEFAGLYGNKPEAIRDLCKEIGLIPISAHVPYEEMIADPEGTMQAYKTIGCRYIAVPYLVPEKRPGTPGWSAVQEGIKVLGKAANAAGLTLLYHNHDFEFGKTAEGEYLLDALYREVPAELLQTELDTCWVKVGGEDPAGYVRKYSGRAPVVHLKDYTGEKSDSMYKLIGIESKEEAASPDKFCLRPVGSGCQNFPSIIDAAKDAGAEWLIVEQDEADPGHTPLECAKISREYLRSIGY